MGLDERHPSRVTKKRAYLGQSLAAWQGNRGSFDIMELELGPGVANFVGNLSYYHKVSETGNSAISLVCSGRELEVTYQKFKLHVRHYPPEC